MSVGRATDQAIAKIKDLISSGEFAGSRLPTERELTQRFGVSRSSLREATRALALVGVLESRVGDGTYVTTLEPELLLTGVGFVSDLVSVGSLLEIDQDPRRWSERKTVADAAVACSVGFRMPARPRPLDGVRPASAATPAAPQATCAAGRIPGSIGSARCWR
jgi:GntR family transcriptional regulator, transcriptional repressor for pyruvate dehydrogenase complex